MTMTHYNTWPWPTYYGRGQGSSSSCVGLGGAGTVRGRAGTSQYRQNTRRDHEYVRVIRAITEWVICLGWIAVTLKVGGPGAIKVHQVTLTAVPHVHAQVLTRTDADIGEPEITERSIDCTEHVHDGTGTLQTDQRGKAA